MWRVRAGKSNRVDVLLEVSHFVEAVCISAAHEPEGMFLSCERENIAEVGVCVVARARSRCSAEHKHACDDKL